MSKPSSQPIAADLARAEAAWQAAIQSLGFDSAAGASTLARLERRYRERHRVYHDLAHVSGLISLLAELDAEAMDPSLVLAAWYHDAVYRPRRSDNEERSAALASAELDALGATAAIRARIERLILATKSHQSDGDQLAAILIDADLAILGTDPAGYDAYAAAIRKEYRWVPAPLYRAGRARVLDGFLARPSIYQTSAGRRRFEEPARLNLARELSGLSPR